MSIVGLGFMLVFGLLALLIAVGVPVLIGVYVYRDAKKRNMDAALWTLIAVLVPSFIGFIVYLVMRGKYPALSCPSCGAGVERQFTRCPNCGNTLKNACPSCHEPVEHTWKVCPACGASLPEYMPPTAQEESKNSLPVWLIVLVILLPLLLVFGLVFGLTMFRVSTTSHISSESKELVPQEAYMRDGQPKQYLYDSPEELFICEVLASPTGEYALSDFTPFHWDYALTFAPYTSTEEMARILGFSSPLLEETLSEGIEQLYFISDEQIVCTVQGYAENIGLGFDFSAAQWQQSEGGAEYLRIERNDNTPFAHVWEGEYPVLRYGG